MLILSRMPTGDPEIFASIQGEGASMGVPSTFVRLATCNLRCSWCDTAYTWDWDRFDRAEQTMRADADSVATIVESHPPRNVVITGGEPLIQRRELVPLVDRLRLAGFRLEVETNGTIAPGELSGRIDQWNVSPKLGHSGNGGLRLIDPDVLRAFAAEPGAVLKLVVQSPLDLAEAGSIIDDSGFDPSRVILMPEGRTSAELAERSTWLAEACAERGYRFSSRLHILLWGDKRGV